MTMMLVHIRCAVLSACFIAVSVISEQHASTTTSTEGAPISSSVPAPVTVSPSGEFLGSWMKTRRGRSFQAYRGIKYAEPPIGLMRFQPPKLIEKYVKPVDASKEGPACPQPADSDYYLDEDCLRLNVYTTGKDTLKPVIVYFHSGGYYAGTGRSDMAGPHYLLDRDLVFVPINYRLASLGFLSTGDELAPGNNGLKDQVAALKWVQRNIASFGGDPHLVTIAGCSAGSFSVMLHMISPMSKGLFHRAISLSGSPISQIPVISDQRSLAVKQATLLGCPTDSSKAILDCLRTKTAKELGDSLNAFYEFAYDPVLIWLPLVEKDYGQERFLTVEPMDVIREGKMHSVPHLISLTTDEFFWKAYTILGNDTFLNKMESDWDSVAPISFQLPLSDARASHRLRSAYVPGPLVNDSATADGLGKLYSDGIIGFGVHRMANLMSRYSENKVFYCQFDYKGNNSHYVDPDTKKPVGTAHHDDLIYLFSINAFFPPIEVSDSEDSKMVDRMTALWYNFARYGDPNPHSTTPALGAVRWPPMTPLDRTYLRLGAHSSLQRNLFEERFKIWEELYPSDLYGML